MTWALYSRLYCALWFNEQDQHYMYYKSNQTFWHNMKTAKHDLRVLGFDIKGTKTNGETINANAGNCANHGSNKYFCFWLVSTHFWISFNWASPFIAIQETVKAALNKKSKMQDTLYIHLLRKSCLHNMLVHKCLFLYKCDIRIDNNLNWIKIILSQVFSLKNEKLLLYMW